MPLKGVRYVKVKTSSKLFQDFPWEVIHHFVHVSPPISNIKVQILKSQSSKDEKQIFEPNIKALQENEEMSRKEDI